MDLADLMDAIATELEALNKGQDNSLPVDQVVVPCAVVGYPTEVDFDVTFKRGSDRMVLPVHFLVGKTFQESAKARLSEILTGATSIKDALDEGLTDNTRTARVTNCKVEEVSVGGIGYLSATFQLEVIG
jgi:hypothetical protein